MGKWGANLSKGICLDPGSRSPHCPWAQKVVSFWQPRADSLYFCYLTLLPKLVFRTLGLVMPHCVTAQTITFMPAWTHAANQSAMQDGLIELVYLGTTMKGYQALGFKCITLMRCFTMFPIFTIINFMSLWAPVQSSRGPWLSEPSLCHGWHTGDTLHSASSWKVKRPKQPAALGAEVNTDREL